MPPCPVGMREVVWNFPALVRLRPYLASICPHGPAPFGRDRSFQSRFFFNTDMPRECGDGRSRSAEPFVQQTGCPGARGPRLLLTTSERPALCRASFTGRTRGRLARVSRDLHNRIRGGRADAAGATIALEQTPPCHLHRGSACGMPGLPRVPPSSSGGRSGSARRRCSWPSQGMHCFPHSDRYCRCCPSLPSPD
jgi:hypothetical protein